MLRGLMESGWVVESGWRGRNNFYDNHFEVAKFIKEVWSNLFMDEKVTSDIETRILSTLIAHSMSSTTLSILRILENNDGATSFEVGKELQEKYGRSPGSKDYMGITMRRMEENGLIFSNPTQAVTPGRQVVKGYHLSEYSKEEILATIDTVD